MRRGFPCTLTLVLAVAGPAWADSPKAVAPSAPAAPSATAAAGKPAPLMLPETQAMPDAKQPANTQAPPAATTAPAPNGTGTNGVAADANGNCAAPQAAPPKVDLRDFHVGPCYRFWFSGDYLLWWTKSQPLPVTLVTTGPGAIGVPGTVTVIGNQDFSYGAQSGARIDTGMWLNECHTLGVDFGLFWLGQGSTFTSFTSSPAGVPPIGRPFFNVVTGTQSVDLIAAPGGLAGGAAVSTQSTFWGLDANLVRNLFYCPNFQADLIAGFRYLDLEENMEITSSSTALPATGGAPGGVLLFPGAPVGSVHSLTLVDRFGTVNHFYGGQLGANFQYRMGAVVFDTLVKCALGTNHETVNVLGRTTASFVGGGSSTVSGGLLAVPGGNYPRNDTTDYFAVVPEVRVGLGYQITKSLRANVAYNFIYLNGVARPGNHIDTNVNLGLVPSSGSFGSTTGPASPGLAIRQTDYWAQGLNFGLTLTY